MDLVVDVAIDEDLDLVSSIHDLTSALGVPDLVDHIDVAFTLQVLEQRVESHHFERWGAALLCSTLLKPQHDIL